MALGIVANSRTAPAGEAAGKPRAQVGAYYFDGWAGKHKLADTADWAKDAPTHLTKRLLDEFADREPLWGWRDDSPEAMKRQIDLAADHGLAFFAFCWYWHPTGKEVQDDPKHTGLDLFVKAPNNGRMKFCLLVANHAGYLIRGTDNWRRAATFWMPYLKHKQHLTVGGKPLVIIFNAGGGEKDGFAAVQDEARKAGLPGVAIAACGPGTIETGYTHTTRYNIVPGYTAGGQEHKFQELAEVHRRAWAGRPEMPCIPCIIGGWDCRPWEGPNGLGNKRPGWYFPDRTPEQFGAHVRDAVEWMEKHPERATAEKLAVIYAWNEFGEGGYIAPTKGDPEAKYLQALKAVVLPDAP
ncbi:MAG TPA: glycoside hydrolase family 99-like domain-containing protein [Planctomycetota bacterium]|nr:glycoside hydrolase family 99-like domain-containing protein [Planctomycetota bacterium]